MATTVRPVKPSSKTTRSIAPRRFVSDDGLLTVKDWLALSETKPRYELIKGKLVQKKLATFANVHAVGSFLIRSTQWGDELGWQFFLQGIGIYINEYNGYIPDLIGFKPDAVLDPKARISAAPFMAIEVLGTAQNRRERKINYAKIGVQLYILIDPNTRTFEAYRLEDQKYGAPEALRENDVWQPAELPGLRLELSQLWM